MAFWLTGTLYGSKTGTMAEPRKFQKIDILIPGYSIEDIPTDLNERSAASLLNAFSVAWHPWLLSASGGLPNFKQAESTELPTGQHIVLIPECSEDWLGHDWKEHFSDTLSVVLDGCSDRSQYLAKITENFSDEFSPVDDELLAHFFALGTCHLQVSLLSRRMHHFVDPDQYLLESESLAAAKAAIEGRSESAHDHLRRCFECLLECREQFQPVSCFLLDVCLPSDQTTAQELGSLIEHSKAISLICSGRELCKFEHESPEFRFRVESAVRENRLSLLMGHQNELRTSLGSLSTIYSDIAQLPNWVKQLTATSPLHWARRRFGMTSSLPSLLSHFNFASALHVVLDDGLYPDREYGQLSWRAPDGSAIPAVSRIPMAIDGASSFLRFADRYTESMQEDSTAVMLLARLPNVQTPWLNDLQIACSYSPVLGSFVTMSEFIDQTADRSYGTKFDEGEYLSPYLIQSSVLKTEAPISSPAELHKVREQLEACCFVDALCTVLKPKQSEPVESLSLETLLNNEESKRITLAADETDTAAEQSRRLSEIAADVSKSAKTTVNRLSTLVPHNDAGVRGIFLANPLPWKRSECITWPADMKLPANSESITDAWRQGQDVRLDVDIPAGGFLWLCEADGPASAALQPNQPKGKPLAEPFLLRNKFFEVQVSEATGGLAAVRFHNQRANRISQQVNFRYANSKTIKSDDEEFVTSYAVTRMVSSRIVNTGSSFGELETSCEIVDVVDRSVLAKFRQTFLVDRNSTRLHLTIQFDEVCVPPSGNPWMTYFASRFAWDNESAAITRSLLGQAAGFRMERFEAPDYIEIADSDHRVLIVPHGRPYHRRSGPRMLDSLLLVEGEAEKRFELTLDFYQPVPARTAAAVGQPCLITETSGARPKAADSGWLLGLSAKNVVAARTRVVVDRGSSPSTQESVAGSVAGYDAQPTGESAGVESSAKVVILLQETEGRSASCTIRTVRPVKSARLMRADGTTLKTLANESDSVLVELSAFQIKEVELSF